MTKQEIAYKLEHNILDRVSVLLDLLPDNLTKENKDKCADVCKGIDQITSDAFAEADALGITDLFGGWRRILIPYWSMNYGYSNTRNKLFTWDAFLDYALECDCTKIEKNECYNRPSFILLNKHNNPEFVVALERDE